MWHFFVIANIIGYCVVNMETNIGFNLQKTFSRDEILTETLLMENNMPSKENNMPTL